MRAALFRETGGPEVLQVETLDPPEPGAGEILIRVTCAGLNRADVLFRQGRYFVQPRFPSRIGKEAAGVIEAVGAGTAYHVGDRVATLPAAAGVEGNQSPLGWSGGPCFPWLFSFIAACLEHSIPRACDEDSSRRRRACQARFRALTRYGATNGLGFAE